MAEMKLRNWNILMLFISVSILFFFLVSQSPKILDIEHIQTCGNHEMSNVFCATCGVTRSVYAFFNFQFYRSILFNPIGFYISVLIVCEISFRLYFIITKQYYRNYYKFHFFVLVSVFAFIIANWHYLN